MSGSGAEALPSRIVLDTSAHAHARRGSALALDAIDRAEVVYLPATVLGELEAGSRPGAVTARTGGRSTSCSATYVHVLDVTPRVAGLYGELFAALKRAAIPIPVNDIWIAAAAPACGAHLLTFDEDFARIEGLRQLLYLPETP